MSKALVEGIEKIIFKQRHSYSAARSPRAGGRKKKWPQIIVASLSIAAISHQAVGQPLTDDAGKACERAASRAEQDWQLPAGLLAAIGIVESGRRAYADKTLIIWPWTININLRGIYQPTKMAAINMVRAFQLRGLKVIDVGCFQVNLFYHASAFSSLEEAFDPDANARAAARILSSSHSDSSGWDRAIAAYHSASPLLGTAYLHRVQAAWQVATSHPGWIQTDTPEAYTALLSPQARRVKVVTPADPGSAVAIQWLHPPVGMLPIVLPAAVARVLLSKMRHQGQSQ